MQFSRTHAGMLAVVSIFTGVIAPIGSYGPESAPLPLTDMQWIAYPLFVLLIIVFYIISVGKWRKLPFYGYSIIGLIVIVFGYSLTDSLHSIKTGFALTELSWGWIFLFSGVIMLIGVMAFEYDTYPAITPLSDKLIGFMGSGTILLLSLIVLGISFSWPKGYVSTNVLSNHFETGSTRTQSGITFSPPFDTIQELGFKRKKDALSYLAKKGDAIIENKEVLYLGNKKIEYLTGSTLLIDGVIPDLKVRNYWNEDEAMVLAGKESLTLLSTYAERLYTGAANVTNITKDQSNKTIAWAEKIDEGYIVKRNGEIMPGIYANIDIINLSPSGYDVMVKGRKGVKTEIFKNGESIAELGSGYITGTYQSNGSHFIYKVKDGDTYRIVYDGSFIPGKYEEIREIFLERSGNSYAYFGRPLGERKYCLFTRYRGNICGIEGYMNPRLSADGGSVLYAAMIDSIWQIMRNSSTVTKNTGYNKTDISHDYVFFDITNPRQFVFISYETDGTYTLIKNGKKLSGSWQDIGLDVQFGYDNKMIMSAKTENQWYIIEF